MKRRDFIKTGVIGTSSIMFVNSALGQLNPVLKDESIDDIYRGFQNPPIESHLYVRWWWNGNRLDATEILRELDVMQASGIGGVEINPIAFPEGSDAGGIKAMTIFTEEWLEMLEVALKGTKERGMVCDMIVGSGWPFGGEFLKKQEQSQMVTIETIDLKGGEQHKFSIDDMLIKVDPEVHSRNDVVYRDLMMARLLPKKSNDFVEGIDLMDQIKGDDLIINAPNGEHVLYYVVKLTGYMAVINGSPGAAGPVLNHYSKQATENYLNRISSLITGKVGHMGDYIRAMFCDSMELEGANWNDDILDEFEKRRGYSLAPYLPFVLKKVGHMGNPLEGEYGTKFSNDVSEVIKRVDLDYYHTRIELFKERFIDTFNDWCHRNGVLSRMQAYGRGMHPLEASMEIDLPDSETWLYKELGKEYPDTGLVGRAPKMCNKYVASAAALAGKDIVCCEEVTNTEMAFMATLEAIKIAGDQSNISGVNQSILHGYNYSPLDTPFPGWVRYGSYFNERNTWWPYFKNWANYKARISYILQRAIPQANIAILQPLTDLWLKEGPQRDPFPQAWYPEYQNNMWEAVHQNGGGCDYVSENIIKASAFKNGKMHYNNRAYDTLLMPAIETLDLETAKSLAAFAKAGGKIVFIEKKPHKSVSYKNVKTNDAAVNNIVMAMLNDKNGNTVEYLAPNGDVINWYRKLQEDLHINSYVKFDKTHKFFSQSPYQVGENKMFFFANSSLSEHISLKAEFQVDENLYPWIWNPETGIKMRYPTDGKHNRLDLEIPRATSLIIIFEKYAGGATFQILDYTKRGHEITGEWQLQLNHMNGERNQITLSTLTDLINMDQTRYFAGEVIYKKTISLDEASYDHIDLGDVQGVSELTLNGKVVGEKWYGVHRYEVKGKLKKGKNKISIKLTTITGNYMKSLIENDVAKFWTIGQDHFSMGLIGPVRIL